MNSTPIRTGIVLFLVAVLAGCATHRSDQRQTANDLCQSPSMMTCEDSAGGLSNCRCATEGDLRRMFEML